MNVYACDRTNKAYAKLEGHKGQLNIVLEGMTRKQVKNALKGVHTLQGVQGSKDKIHPIDLENILVVDSFFIDEFITRVCPKNKQVREFVEDMNHDELVEFITQSASKLGRKLETSL